MLQAQGISHTFAGQRTPALTDVSFALEAGECVALIGPNGCGKSTLARSLGGAIQPKGGTVLLDGVPPQDAWWRVGMVSQDARSQLVNEVVYDEVAFGPRNMALSEEEVDRRVREALATCDLSEYVAAQVLELSGGEQQRLALAGILAVDPQHVILDEYSAHLDEGMRLRLRELLEDLKRRGKAILVVTHLVEEVLPADRVVLMQEGAIAWQGSVDELLASEELLGKSGLCRTPRLEVLSHTKQAASRYATHGSFSPKENVLCTGLQLQNVWAQAGKSFSLKDISLRVTPGKVTLVAGLPGAGKTTMLQVSAGVLAPESGEALLDYEPIVLGEVAFCRQHPEEQLFCASVLEDVAYGPQCVGMSSEEANERATAALETMGVGRELWDRSPFSLSGGERRRVAIAGILALQQKAIVLDEPTAGLDDEGCALLFDTVRNLASRGVAVLVTSHDVDLWLRYADVVALMRDGRIVYQGTAARVSKDPQAFVQAGLAVPFSVAQQQEGDAPNLVGSAEKSREVRKVKGGPMANLPPVVKVWGLVAATIAVFMTSNPLVLAAMVTASGLLCAMAGMRPKNALRALKSVGIVLALSLLANAVILDGSGDVSLVGPLSLSTTGMVRGVCTVARIVVLVLLVAVVAHSTTTGDIANALLAPLGIFERLGMHTANARLAVTLALRCVPLSMETFRSVEMAQRTRGAQIGIGGLKERLSSWIAVLVPMVVVLMQRADDLGDALTLRGFGRTYGEEGTDDE